MCSAAVQAGDAAMCSAAIQKAAMCSAAIQAGATIHETAGAAA
jgi:hypothetical protein